MPSLPPPKFPEYSLIFAQKPYGVEFKAYRYNVETEWFDLVPEYELQRAAHLTAS